MIGQEVDEDSDEGAVFLEEVVDDRYNRLVASRHPEDSRYSFSVHNGVVNGYDFYKCKVVWRDGRKMWRVKSEKIFEPPEQENTDTIDDFL